MSETKKKNRIFYFDEIRALAILFVLLVHLSKWFVSGAPEHDVYWLFARAMQAIGNLGVPLFLTISGALLLNRKYELKSFFKRRYSRVLIPFIFWIAIIILFKMFYLGSVSNFGDIFDTIFKDGFVWFIWMILGVYLFIPVINSFISEYGMKGVRYFLIIWLVTTILRTLGWYPLESFDLSYFAGYIGYFVLGYYLNNEDFKISDKSLMKIGLIIYIISTAVYIYCAVNKIYFKDTYYLVILPVIQTAGIFLFFKYRAQYSESGNVSISQKIYSAIKNSSIGKIVVSISLCSYGMFLTHYIFIWILRHEEITKPIFSGNPFIWLPLAYIGIVLFSWGLTYVCSKIPFLKEFSGA